MNQQEHANPMLDHLQQWGKEQPTVRAMLLTSSLAVPNGPVDLLSDYDVILVMTDILPFHAERAWLEAFGPVLALYHDPLELYYGVLKSAYVVQYESGLKIDFTLWPVAILQQIVADPQLPAEFDAGYQILLDKDHLTAGLKPPTYQAFIPKPPTEAEYQTLIEVFFLEAGYVAKFLWRDDVIAAKHILDHIMKQDDLRPMLEWHIELAHAWSVKPGPYGRRLKRWLRPDLWTALASTYTGADVAENWTALFNTIALFRQVATEVGAQLGYAYPDALHRRTLAYLEKVQRLDPKATHFG